MKKHGIAHSYNKQAMGGNVNSVAAKTGGKATPVNPLKTSRSGGGKTHNPSHTMKY